MKKFLAISLTLIMLISNIGLTMATHYCGGQAVKSQLMLGHDHLGCNMPDMENHGKAKKRDHYEATGCCENQYQTLEVEDDFRSGIVQMPDFNFVLAFVQTFLHISLISVSEKPQYANYSPPLLLRDIPVMNQVFLI